MMMAAVEMIYGWASSAHTAWDAPMGIWAYIGGLKTSATRPTTSGRSCSESAGT
jgi:hypothetical protein